MRHHPNFEKQNNNNTNRNKNIMKIGKKYNKFLIYFIYNSFGN